jgi:hypothetical protein
MHLHVRRLTRAFSDIAREPGRTGRAMARGQRVAEVLVAGAVIAGRPASSRPAGRAATSRLTASC